jgi:hypothetical protein
MNEYSLELNGEFDECPNWWKNFIDYVEINFITETNRENGIYRDNCIFDVLAIFHAKFIGDISDDSPASVIFETEEDRTAFLIRFNHNFNPVSEYLK